MTKKDLIKIIREVVKREVKGQINSVLTEMESKPSTKMSIKEAMDNTAAYPTMKEFTSKDARAGFAALQSGHPTAGPQTDLNGKVVDVSSLGQGLEAALTRDYSKLVKKMDK